MRSGEKNLEEMQSQISILKEKIEKKSVVNDKLIHDVISTHTDNIKRKMFAAVVCGLITIAMSPTAFHYNLGMSWLFVIVTDIFDVLQYIGGGSVRITIQGRL